MPHVELPAKSVDRGGHGKWVVGAGQGRDHSRYAGAYAKASKKDKGRILDEVCVVTGWSRDNARRRLVAAARRTPGHRKPEPRARARRYSYDALKVLQLVWAAIGGQCGKYLKESMPMLPGPLEVSGELDDEPCYSPAVRSEPGGYERARPSTATSPRHGPPTSCGAGRRPRLAHCRAAPSRSARPATRPSPGSSRPVAVAHCGPTLKGEFARGREHDRCSHRVDLHPLDPQQRRQAHHLRPGRCCGLPAVTRPGHGLRRRLGAHQPRGGQVGGGPGHLLPPVRAPTRRTTRPPSSLWNNHLVRRYAFYYRYDTSEEREVLGRLWEQVNVKLNFLPVTLLVVLGGPGLGQLLRACCLAPVYSMIRGGGCHPRQPGAGER